MDKQDKILKRIRPYLCGSIIDWYTAAEPGQVHEISRHNGYLVFIDVSGFTGLTRTACQGDPAGIENLTDSLNRFFDSMARVVYAYRGDILKFAGDALWALLPDKTDPGHLYKALLDALSNLNKRIEIDLNIHIGVSYGQYHLASFGDSRFRLEIEPIGDPVRQAMLACDQAGSNQMVLHESARHSIINLPLKPIDEEFYILHNGSEGFGLVDFDLPCFEHSPEPLLDILEKYLPGNVLKRIKTLDESGSLQSEYRQVSVLFASFEYDAGGTGETVSAKIRDSISACFGIVNQTGGNIARVDPYYDSHKLLALFGAPVKWPGDEMRAIRCAQKLVELNGDGLRIKVGLAHGTLYCGEVGAEFRKEYTVMGDSVNLAARLMAAAEWGQILLDGNMKNAVPRQVKTVEKHLELKGVDDNGFHLFDSIRDKTSISIDTHDFVFHNEDIQRIHTLLSENDKGGNRAVFISADSGTGKSAFLSDLWRTCSRHNRLWLDCKHALLFGHAWLIRTLLAECYLAFAENNHSLEQFSLRMVDEKWHPLLSDLLGLDIPENNWTSGLDAELKLEKSCEIFSALLDGMINKRALIFVDDLDRVDEFSQKLLISYARNSQNRIAGFIFSCDHEFNIPDDERFEIVALENPSRKEWQNYFEYSFEQGRMEQELFDALIRASDCNPQFIFEYINRALHEDVLVRNEVSSKLEVGSAITKIEMPMELSDMQLARFDSLDEAQRQLLKTASVSGGDFSVTILKNLHGEMEAEAVQSYLQQLMENQFLEHSETSDYMRFRHESMREAVYNTVPRNELVKLHEKYYWNLSWQSGIGEEILARHAYKAGLFNQAFNHALNAAETAYARFSLIEASRIFEYCDNILQHCRIENLSERLIFQYYRKRSDLLIHQGDYRRAYSIYRKWRKHGASRNEMTECLNAVVESARLLWRQSRYARARKLLDVIDRSGSLGSYPAIEAEACLIQAEIDRRAGRFGDARKFCQRAIDVAEEIQDRLLLSSAYNRLGLAQWGAGDLGDAADSFRNSLESGREDGGMFVRAQIANNLAIIHWEKGDFIAAHELMKEAVDIYSNVGDRRRGAYASGNLASLYRIFGRFHEARELFQRADLIFNRLHDKHAHCYIVGNLGDIDLMEGRLDQARKHFCEAMNFAEEVEDKEFIAECKVRFGELAFIDGEIEYSFNLYSEAVELADKIGSSEFQLRGLIGLARLCILNREPGKARGYIERIDEIASASNIVTAQYEKDFLQGERHRILLEPKEALKEYKKVLFYALSHNLFELILKSAVRIYELEHESRVFARDIIARISRTFIENNSLDCWQKMVVSPYLAYFSETIKSVLGSHLSPPVHTL